MMMMVMMMMRAYLIALYINALGLLCMRACVYTCVCVHANSVAALQNYSCEYRDL